MTPYPVYPVAAGVCFIAAIASGTHYYAVQRRTRFALDHHLQNAITESALMERVATMGGPALSVSLQRIREHVGHHIRVLMNFALVPRPYAEAYASEGLIDGGAVASHNVWPRRSTVLAWGQIVDLNDFHRVLLGHVQSIHEDVLSLQRGADRQLALRHIQTRLREMPSLSDTNNGPERYWGYASAVLLIAAILIAFLPIWLEVY